MRLKSYTAATMAEAMEQVRMELGEDAIIVSTQRASGGAGVRVSAALEEVGLEDDIVEALTGHSASSVVETIREALASHGTPKPLIDQIALAAKERGGDDLVSACAVAFETGFVFAPLPETAAPRPFMLIGPPGTGKTVTTAKLAAQAVIGGRSVAVVSADAVRAGATEQLEAFTRILQINVIKARGPEALHEALIKIEGKQDLVFIDSPGLNPFKAEDVEYLADLIAAGDVEPILVMAAGGDAIESAEIAKIFGNLGATRLLATRLDMTHRLGSILAAAAAGDLMFCDVTVTPHVATGLCPLTPKALARLILPSQETAEETLEGGFPSFEEPEEEFSQTEAML